MADQPTQTGRWRCVLCPSPAWAIGTMQDALAHYYDRHWMKEERDGTAVGQG